MGEKAKMIGVLTYNVPHRKTYDTLCLLKSKGYEDVIVYAIPLQYKKKFSPQIAHRPEMIWDVQTQKMCESFGYEYEEILQYDEIKQPNGAVMLVCGAGLLPDDFIKKYKVINAHPGYIPNCRGLDALKWAIYEGECVGVTTHLIGDEVDAGEVISRKKIPIYKNDTFHLVAQRVYENEIELLVEAISDVQSQKPTSYISGNGFEVHKRMPNAIELELYNKFEEYKKAYATY